MENIENVPHFENPITIDNEIKGYLLESSKWGKFLAIVGFIGMGFLLLLGIAFLVGFSSFSSIAGTGFPMIIIGFVYIIISVLYFFPLKYLYNFSVQLTQGIIFTNQQAVTSGFKNLKSIFRFMGIFTIVILSIYALIIVVAVPLAIFFAVK